MNTDEEQYLKFEILNFEIQNLILDSR